MSNRPLSVLAFESYDTGSHRSVRKLIAEHSRHRWCWLTRPGRGWKWRMRLAAVELLDEAARAGRLDAPVDVIFATSLLGAADLRALLPPHLRNVPLVLYMHENQATYPVSDHPRVDSRRDVHFALTNLTSVLAADHVIWNSAWNLRSFLNDMDGIIRRANCVELEGWQARVESRSQVVWPPVEPPPSGVRKATDGHETRQRQEKKGAQRGPVRVVWPHRWEHDKGPDELLAIAERDTVRLNLRWIILGVEFPTVPTAMQTFRERMADRIDHFGHEPDRSRYWQHLARADWVLSTARHDFFGVAVVEAMLAGCLPWLPDRLSYPELLPPVARGISPARPPSDPAAVRSALAAHLEPAVAPRAVAAIDDALEQAAEGGSAQAADGST